MSKCKQCEATIDEGQELCSFCINLMDIEIKTERKILKKQKYNPLPKPKFIKVKCTKCGRNEEIRTNKPELYTDKVKSEWICLLCTGFKKKEVKNGPTEISNTVPEQQGQQSTGTDNTTA